MKKKTIRIISKIMCGIILLMFFQSSFMICNTHMFTSKSLECSQCLMIYNIQSILQRIFLIEIVRKLIIVIKTFIMNNLIAKCNIFGNPFLMKVRLNE